jgi:hypothetical protein
MGNLVHNERVKYRATFCNGVAVVAFATGAILPALQGQSHFVYFGWFSAGGLVAAAFVALSQWTLGELKE